MALNPLRATTDNVSLLNEFTERVETRQAPGDALEVLHDWVSNKFPLSVLGAARTYLKGPSWRSPRLGRDVFLHASAPEGWWDEYAAMASRQQDPAAMIAKCSLMGCTWTETMQMIDPVGIDRWPYEISLKHGIRDGFLCAVARRWLVIYWSRKVLGNVLTQPMRIVLFAAASLTALRLDQLTDPDSGAMGERARATPRELAVLRLVSLGKQTEEIAELLGLGEETVRSHLKKVHSKLGARNRAHAAAEAIRQQLIP
jgi:DNA-binding CsgD family transcriptional regulator